ncbi:MULTISPECIES: hypothetical protein [unclassified Yoonia]|uniref:hypothetical protein n=1 Tax=unclassified Yoonia TaxID=2629118 RepID=UPI002AFE54AF|nr:MULTISPECIES: hypothetical protein [unclassified Yoonia]
MLRFFNMFGRSSALIALDEALRAAGLHPLLIPEPVKLTILQLQRKYGTAPDLESGLALAAPLLAYCVLDSAQFTLVNGEEAAAATEARVIAAMDQGDTLDAKLILLALHSGVISEDMADRFELETGMADAPD